MSEKQPEHLPPSYCDGIHVLPHSIWALGFKILEVLQVELQPHLSSCDAPFHPEASFVAVDTVLFIEWNSLCEPPFQPLYVLW